MAVIVNGQRFLEEADVQGNPDLAQQEANKQLAFARSELKRRDPETRVDKDNKPDPNGQFVNAQRVTNLKENIASQLPAVVIGVERQPETTQGPLQVTIGGGQFVISENWPVVSDTAGETSSTPAPGAPQVSTPAQPTGDPNLVNPEEVPGVTGNVGPEVITPNSEVVGGGSTGPDGGIVSEATPGGTESSNTGAVASGNDIDSAGNTEISESSPAGSGQQPGQAGTGNGINQSAAQSAVKGKGRGGLEADLNVQINPQENELDQFQSYTYNVSLYMLKPKEYVRMLKAPNSIRGLPKALLMRNGGTGGDRELAQEFQNTEFFIDDITFDNIGPNPNTQTSNTNAIDIKFNVFEPNGCTFIERLKKQSELSLEEEQSYLHTPYLLEIKFKGYDDVGKPSNEIVKPKYIPIKFIDMKFAIDTMGTSYRIKAYPYHHDVFSTLRSTIPVNVQVSAGSVKDILKGTAIAFTTETNREVSSPAGDDETIDITTTSKDVLGEKAVSLPEAVNNHFEAQTRSQTIKDPKTGKTRTVLPSATVAENWQFEVADDILNSKLVGSTIDALNTTQKTKNVYQQYGSVMKGKVNLTKDKKLFKINAGTNIIDLINYIIVASEYVKQNLIPLDLAAKNKTETDSPIQWFKVVPQITKFLGWDKKQGKYKFQITWTVQTQGVFYNDYPWAPKTKPKGEGIHKIYDYIYTGENKHIMNLKLNFDMAYYHAAQIGTGNPISDKTPNTLSPQIKEVPQATQGQNLANDETVEDKRAKDLMGTIMHDGSDLLQLDMEIIGDPAYLPTGDGFWQPQGNQNRVYSTAFLPDGTINYDLTPPYIQLNFKTPVDYDDFTGLADPNINKKYGTSEFNGVYQVIKVSNSLSGGVFSQSINAVRTKMQPVLDRVGRSRESLENRDRSQFQQAQDLRNLFLSIAGNTRNLPINSLAGKITRAADSSITNITTNVLPKLGQELDQVATNAIPELQRAGNQMRNFFNQQFPERPSVETDTFNNEDIDI